MGSIGQLSTFPEHGHAAYQIKINRNHLMQQHGSKYFAHRTTIPLLPDPRVGSIGPISTFSEHGHVAYQIKWNLKMQQHSSKYFAQRGWSLRVKVQLFQKRVMLHFKFKRIMNAAIW